MPLWFYDSVETLQKVHKKRGSKHTEMTYFKGKGSNSKRQRQPLDPTWCSLPTHSPTLHKAVWGVCPASQPLTPRGALHRPEFSAASQGGRQGPRSTDKPSAAALMRSARINSEVASLTVERTRHKLFSGIPCLLRWQQTSLWAN